MAVSEVASRATLAKISLLFANASLTELSVSVPDSQLDMLWDAALVATRLSCRVVQRSVNFDDSRSAVSEITLESRCLCKLFSTALSARSRRLSRSTVWSALTVAVRVSEMCLNSESEVAAPSD